MDGDLTTTFLKRFRPLHLFSGILLYAMGVGISDYLGGAIDPQTYILGQAWVTTSQLGFYFLGDYLGRSLDLGLSNRPPFQNPSKNESELLQDDPFLFASLLFLSLSAALTFFLKFKGIWSVSAIFLMVALVAGYVVRVLPGLSPAMDDFDELIHSLQMVVFIPALGFLFQAGGYHRFLGLATFPLFALHLAMLLIFRFPTYATDLAHRKVTILTRMGWENGIFIHNILVIFAFLVLGLSSTFGFPTRFVYPAFLALPFGAFQVWYMIRLRQGAPTRWKLITVTAAVSFFFPAYLLTYSFWTQ